ncbi:hypothetical protein ERJ70_02350 [Sediminibacillus dalangtanensis]|uniref:Uncharacterized protein n=1 Tax=Sediminibacillus dalangtanensis TaxID=2729421 RepID=A0ABX7VN56_9BACI|nr:hypothetical protein [Sediminibacillus dalangtanensis]QTM98256.1 hypothetical protein ERJ70_02350 [Sediminibacillus dalangtanensis]
MKITPENTQFAAYSRLTVSAHLRNQLQNGASMSQQPQDISFSKFQQLLEQEKVVDQKNVREMSAFHRDALEAQMHYTNHSKRTLEVKEIMEKAFTLGLVDKDNTLINKVDEKV